MPNKPCKYDIFLVFFFFIISLNFFYLSIIFFQIIMKYDLINLSFK